jgi:hypothetical protein
MSKCFSLVTRHLNAAGGAAILVMLANLTGPPAGAASAAQPSQSFSSRSFAGSLMFGMSPEEAATALGVPLTYVRGPAGDELFLAIPNVKGNALSIRSDGLYLQFRRGRLMGWKGDWGTARPLGIGW